ncbi:hypothetical protein EBR04_00940 [bacterium]|nr:hypothetical protein [bacterium]
MRRPGAPCPPAACVFRPPGHVTSGKVGPPDGLEMGTLLGYRPLGPRAHDAPTTPRTVEDARMEAPSPDRRLGAARPGPTAPAAWLAAAVVVLASLAHVTAADPLDHAPTGTITGHPALSRSPRHTTTARGHQGDAVNVAFVGSEEDLHRTLSAAGWYAADPITLKTSLEIAADVVLHKPYAHAPVSDLFLWGRKQDAAFEQPVGNSPKQRHHVRFWKSAEVDGNGEPLWLGAATFDERVEISREAGGITHRIGADIDRERNKLLVDTRDSGVLDGFYWVDRFHRHREGRNGGGDPYYTDGRLAVGVIIVK